MRVRPANQQSTMRILFISNFYPPNFIGGYELGCSRVVKALESRGHICRVLTSQFSNDNSNDAASLRFWLNGRRPQRLGRFRAVFDDQWNRRTVRREVARFGPDVIYVWNPMLLTPGVVYETQCLGRPVSFFVSDEWPGIWQTSEDASFNRLNNAMTFAPARWAYHALSCCFGTGRHFGSLNILSGQFASAYLHRKAASAGVALGDACVVNWGIERDNYLCERDWLAPAKTFLYAGQLSNHKGVHTALEAFASVASVAGDRQLRLSLAGSARDVEYESMLKEIVHRYGVSDRVEWLGKLDESQLQAVYKSHDAFLFPSAWNEPFSIALVEAMTAGMVVLSTITGGTGELVQDNQNALVFDANDIQGCARQIRRVSEDLDVCRRLSVSAAADTANLTLKIMVDSLEELLGKTLTNVVDERLREKTASICSAESFQSL